MPIVALLAMLSAAAPAADMAPMHYESPEAPEPGDAHYDLEELYAASRFPDGLKAARAKLAADPTDPDLYWLTGRFMFEIAEQVDRTDTSFDKRRWYEEMVDLAEKGLELAPDHPHLEFLWGVAKGRWATTRGVLRSLFVAKDVERSWVKVAESGFRYNSLDDNEILPCDAFLTLGIFYRIVPDSGFVKFLGGVRGDLDTSLDWHVRANRCSPGRIGLVKELGVTELCIGSKRDDQAMIDKGSRHLRDLQKLPSTTATDDIDKRHATMLIADPSLACEYSRDGQQDYEKEAKEVEK